MATTYNYTNQQTQSAYYGTASNFGNYQFITLDDICKQFMVAWCGDDKVLAGTSKGDVLFHAHRTLQELTYDTLTSCLTQEIEIPPGLVMPLPHDYINYVKLTWVDNGGVEHIIYPQSKTGNPFAIDQNAAGTYQFTGSNLTQQPSTTGGVTDTETQTTTIKSDSLTNYQEGSSLNANSLSSADVDEFFTPHLGERYGLDPQHSQSNGWFFINCRTGLIHFSSILSGKTVVLKYISDGINSTSSTDIANITVHKFAEEAMYQNIAYAIASTKGGTQEYIIQRFRQTAIASKRRAKIRMSNIKLEEISQTFRGISKQIKH